MIVKTIVDDLNDTNIYIIYDNITKKAIIIDPNNFKSVDEFIGSFGLNINYIILTHEHFDHILGVNELLDKYGCSLVTSEICNIGIMNPKINLSSFSEVLLYFKNNHNGKALSAELKEVKSYICRSADICFKKSKILIWNNHKIQMYETPGHSKGSICIIVDNKYLFSGDSLLKDIDVITRFPGGSTKEYNNITLEFYKSLDKDIIVYPGHGQSFILKEKFKVEEN